MKDINQKSEELKEQIYDLSDKMKSLSKEIEKVKIERNKKVSELMHIWDKD